jgi:methylated-DNA-[protein]-cysteine S-methyltransferase
MSGKTISQEQELRGLVTTAPAEWPRLRQQLTTQAQTLGLLDVVCERHETPLGVVVLAATSAGLVRLGLPAESEDAFLDDLACRVSARILFAPRAVLARTRTQLDEYFQGRRHIFDVTLDWRLSSGFRREVLRATSAIPYGQTASYREVASAAGNGAAARAAGTALATNPLPLLVPCHRVLRSDGALGGYGGGLAAKQWLLALESGQ